MELFKCIELLIIGKYKNTHLYTGINGVGISHLVSMLWGDFCFISYSE